ncbi:MAG: hypothetical protein IJW59_05840 [Clostridia bacterium]|nr:hypothetical protein [Clostridia bacterium]
MFTDEEKQNIVDFFNACNDMIEGRFILSDTKVSNILKSIVKSETLYDLYSRCMNGFRFAHTLEFCKASNPNNGGYFQMPREEKDIVAFVTCLLLEVDKRNINLQTFVTDNFYSADGYNISYNNFALLVLVEYKTAVKNLLGVDDKGNVIETEDFSSNQVSIEETVEEAKANENTKILFANLMLSIVELQNSINEDSKIKYNEKEELLIVLKALNRAVHIEDLIIINALLVPLERSLSKNKRHKDLYDKLKLLIADIYY